MKIEYFHGSVYGNGAMIAEEFKKQMNEKGITVNIHNIKNVKPKEIPNADLYLFGSPGRFGKPARNMQNFLKKANLVQGSKYAVIVTELNPSPDSSSIRIPTEENAGMCQQVIPLINKTLNERGLVKMAEGKVFVTGIRGPLEDGWQKIVEEFASRIPIQNT